eukprot:gene17247-biopygen2316
MTSKKTTKEQTGGTRARQALRFSRGAPRGSGGASTRQTAQFPCWGHRTLARAWRGRGAGFRQLLAWVARAWRGRGTGWSNKGGGGVLGACTHPPTLGVGPVGPSGWRAKMGVLRMAPSSVLVKYWRHRQRAPRPGAGRRARQRRVRGAPRV